VEEVSEKTKEPKAPSVTTSPSKNEDDAMDYFSKLVND